MFLTAQADRERLPVALLTGFLGSGKTTLVNALLGDPRMAGTAVAINEFGEVPIDHALIDQGAERTVVMANGCLCCNLAGDLDQAVMRLFARRQSGELPRFARLIIEPSGLADPAPIAQAILRNPLLSRALRLEAIVATVDAQFAELQLARHAETRKQMSLADTLVLTKPDLIDHAAEISLREKLRALNPSAPITVARHGAVDAAALFPAHFLDPSSAMPARRSALSADDAAAPAGHLGGVASVSLGADQPLRWRAFEAWLRGIRLAHADRLLRVKGLLNIDGRDGPVAVQGIHHVVNVPVALESWPGPDRRSWLVLIADPPTTAAARTSWASALPAMMMPARQ